MDRISERIDQWLRDAHAAEAQAATMLRGTAGRNADYPEFSRRLSEHAELCDNHARAIDQCLTERGSSPSLVKDITGQMTAWGQSLSGMVVDDEVVKAALATLTFAHMLVGSGRALAAGAAAEGQPETERACQAMVEENGRFAAELEDMLPSLTVEYLTRATSEPVTADNRVTADDPVTADNNAPNHPVAPTVG